jgi:hypothetical protein
LGDGAHYDNPNLVAVILRHRDGDAPVAGAKPQRALEFSKMISTEQIQKSLLFPFKDGNHWF